MLVVTNRHVINAGADASFGEAFTPAQSALSIAQAAADANGQWSLQQVVPQASDAQIGTALVRVFSGDRPVLLYIHGNNNSPVKCFERCALLAKMYGVEVVGFSWPSEGKLPDGSSLPNTQNNHPDDENDLADVRESNRLDSRIVQKARRYRQAKNNAQDSVDALARFLRLMAIARLQANGQPFSVAAHSLGSHYLQYTLEIDVAREALGSAQNIALVAPCVRAAGHADWVDRLRPKGQVFITYNDGDSVLFGAFIVDGRQTKLGTDPGGDLVRNGIVRYVCFTRSPVGFGGHGYFVYGKLAKKTKLAFGRMFGSQADIQGQEYPRQVYVAGCDADGAVCYVGVPPLPDGG
jgi:alpha-beta hydrolase superfamily lysophospholipase